MSERTTSGLQDVYRYHHSVGGRLGKTIAEEVRGAFLRERIGKGKKVLDVGCRDGVLTKTYAAGNDVLGLDIDVGALRKAESELRITTKQVDLNGDWGVPQNHFDFVVAGEVIEHLYFPDRVLAKIAATLKEDGVLLGSVPNAFSLQNRIRLFLGNKRATPLSDPTHINHFSHRELESLLEKHFEKVTLYPEGRHVRLDTWFPGWFSFMMLFEARVPKKIV